MGFKAGPVWDGAKFSRFLRYRQPGNLFLTIWHHPWGEGSDGGDSELLRGMWGAAVGAQRAFHPWPELCICFHHTVERDPYKELLRALQSKAKPCKVPLPRVGLSTGAIKTIFSRKLLMNFGFPPLNHPLPRGAASHFCGNRLGDNSLLIKKKNNLSSFFSMCVQIPALSATASPYPCSPSPVCEPCSTTPRSRGGSTCAEESTPSQDEAFPHRFRWVNHLSNLFSKA